MVVIAKYTVKLVKESACKYEVNKKISTPLDAAEVIREVFDIENETEEVMVLLSLNTKNEVTGAFEVSRGSLNSSIVHPREVFKRALANNASSIIVGHNHPSGNASPSIEDISITKRLQESGKILGIELLDHIIIGEGTYESLKTRGVM